MEVFGDGGHHNNLIHRVQGHPYYHVVHGERDRIRHLSPKFNALVRCGIKWKLDGDLEKPRLTEGVPLFLSNGLDNIFQHE